MIIIIFLIIFQSGKIMMNTNTCPNLLTCKLATEVGFGVNESKRQEFIQTFCNDNEQKWKTCTRYIVKSALSFCPDFVYSDSAMTIDEVIDIFDAEMDMNEQIK